MGTTRFTTAYNSAKARHPDRPWPDPRLFDFLNLVVRKEPVVVRGALWFETPGRLTRPVALPRRV